MSFLGGLQQLLGTVGNDVVHGAQTVANGVNSVNPFYAQPALAPSHSTQVAPQRQLSPLHQLLGHGDWQAPLPQYRPDTGAQMPQIQSLHFITPVAPGNPWNTPQAPDTQMPEWNQSTPRAVPIPTSFVNPQRPTNYQSI